jgi:hypothetical protein
MPSGYKLSAHDVQVRLDVIHGGRVMLVKDTYTKIRGYSTFIDVEFGEWVAIVSNVLGGSCHPKLGMQNRRKTNTEKYGSPYTFGSPVIRAKAQQTCIEHYGVPNPFQSVEIKQQIYDDNVMKYGVGNPQQRQDVKQKTAATNVQRYGVACTLNDPGTREKIIATNLEKYGVENPIQNVEVYKRALATSKKLYIVKHWRTGEKLICAASYEFAFVNWCNYVQVDFDWQIPFVTPLLTKRGKPSIYFIDAYIKTGDFAGIWIEIKGRFTNVRNREKWEWFHAQHPNHSQLWTKHVLINMGILTRNGLPSGTFTP